MDFGAALERLKMGQRLARRSWMAEYIELQRPTENSKMTLPYIYIRTAQGELVPWIAPQTDLLAEDWETLSVVGCSGWTPGKSSGPDYTRPGIAGGVA